MMSVLIYFLSIILLLVVCLIDSSNKEIGASHAAFLMLKAAESGDTDTVIDLIINKRVVINTKNNYGVR